MIPSLLITAVSLALLVYWFRYACLLILEDRAGGELVHRVTATVRFSFPDVHVQLMASPSTSQLPALHGAIERDYKILQDLLQTVGRARSTEEAMLLLDYKVMGLWFRLTRRLAVPQARRALLEMSAILGFLAGEIGGQAAR